MTGRREKKTSLPPALIDGGDGEIAGGRELARLDRRPRALLNLGDCWCVLEVRCALEEGKGEVCKVTK